MGLEIELWESSYSIEGNYSVVGANVVYYGNGVSWNGYGCSGSLIVGGQTVSFSSTFSKSTSRQVLYGTGYFTIYHDSEGRGSVGASASFVTGVSLGTLTASASIGLTTIPRASTITSFPGSFSTGVLGTINLSRKSTGFTHTVSCKIEGVTNNTGLSATSGITDSFTYTPPNSIFKNYPTKTVLNAEITIQTKNGSTNIGSAIVKTFIIDLNGNVKPTTPNINYSLVSPFGNLILQNKTKIDLNPVSSMSDSSAGGSIVSCSISIDNQRTTINWGSSNHWTCEPFNTVGMKNAVVTVTDSRGRSSTNTRSFLVTKYSTPTSNVSYQQNGTNVDLSISGIYENLTNNTITEVDIDYRLQGLTEWTPIAPTQIIAANGVWSTTGAFTGDVNDGIFEIRVIVTDSTMQSSETSILTGKPLLAFKYGGDDLGVRFTEEEAESIATHLGCSIADISLY